MTWRGLLVVLLEILLVILAFGTEFRNFLIIALCLGGLLLFSFVSLGLTSLTLGAKSTLDRDETIRNEKIKYILNIRGILLLPVAVYFFVLSGDTKFSKRRKFRHSLLLLPTVWVNRKIVFEMPCSHVGEWEIGIKKMRIEDVFGFFTMPIIWKSRSSLFKKITVTPRVHNFGEIDARNSLGGFGRENILNTENGDTLSDSRLYRDGDGFRRINWKLSTRTKKLYSRMYETPQEPMVAIVMDACVSGENVNDVIDISCETVVSLVNYFAELNTAVKVVFARCKGEYDTKSFNLREESDIDNIYDYFTNTFFTKNNEQFTLSFLDGIQVLDSNKVYFVTDNPSDELISIFSEINKIGKVACCIVPCGESAQDTTNAAVVSNDIARLSVASADLICERVGEVL